MKEVWNKGKTNIYSKETINAISNGVKSYYEKNGNGLVHGTENGYKKYNG